MAKKNRNRQRQPNPQQKPVSANTQNTGNRVEISTAKPSVDTQAITIDDVAASESQAEFEAKKEALIQQLSGEIEDYEGMKKAAETAATEAQKALSELEERRESLEHEKKDLEEKVAAIQADYNSAVETVKHATEEANAVKSSAEAYASETRAAADSYANGVRRSADEERLNKLKQASDEARAAWQAQIDDLSKQIQEIADRESKLQEDQRKLNKDQRFVEDEKEALEELKEDLQHRKSRYDAANPAKIAAITTELEDERSKYLALQNRYHELQKRLETLQVLMDTVKTEIEDPENGIHIASMNEIVSALQGFRDKYERLAAVYARYPDEAAISALEDKAERSDKLEQENEVLIQERNKYREEVIAANNAKRELETIRQEVEATNALNEHLLQELASHKTALESRTGDTCPSLSKVDTETESNDFVADISKRIQRKV